MSKHLSERWKLGPKIARYAAVDESAERLRQAGLPTEFDALSIGTSKGQVAIVPLDESDIETALLILAAPELLELLKERIKHCPHRHQVVFIDTKDCDPCQRGLAVIAKIAKAESHDPKPPEAA